MPRITKNTGKLYRNTSLRNGGRCAGEGSLYDDYSETSGCQDYEKVEKVRFPNDHIKPEDFNGPVICIKKAKVNYG